MGALIVAENDGCAFALAGEQPAVIVDRDVVVLVEALVLEALDEVAAGALVSAHDAEGVEGRAAGKGPLVVDQEELAGVLTAGVGACPSDAVRAGVAAGLLVPS